MFTGRLTEKPLFVVTDLPFRSRPDSAAAVEFDEAAAPANISGNTPGNENFQAIHRVGNGHARGYGLPF